MPWAINTSLATGLLSKELEKQIVGVKKTITSAMNKSGKSMIVFGILIVMHMF